MSRCPEGGWDIGGASRLVVAALTTSVRLPLSTSVMLSLAGVAAITAVPVHSPQDG